MPLRKLLIFGLTTFATAASTAIAANTDVTFKAGHSSLEPWILADRPQDPEDNPSTKAKIELGKMLFFDPRLSGDGNMSCATCHSPLFGWSDGLPTAKGSKSMVLGRASPTVINTGFNPIQMWDGRKKTLEDQAMGPMKSNEEMNINIPSLIAFLNSNKGYKKAFNTAFPGQEISETTIAKSIASFERTVVSNSSRFDQWLKGKKNALSKQEIRGFKVFVDPERGNCEVCHSGANFTDNGFHNIGLASYGDPNPDLGRYAERPLRLMKGAFKTPTIRDIELTAPYFHDGSAATLEEVVDHYATGGVVKTNPSPNLKELQLSQQEKDDLVAFMKSLTSPQKPFTLPILPN